MGSRAASRGISTPTTGDHPTAPRRNDLVGRGCGATAHDGALTCGWGALHGEPAVGGRRHAKGVEIDVPLSWAPRAVSGMPQTSRMRLAVWASGLPVLLACVLSLCPAPAAAESNCPNVFLTAADVPESIWALSIPEGVPLRDVANQIDQLESATAVDPIEYIPPLKSVPAGVVAWVMSFGFAPAPPGVEKFTSAPVLCLGAQIPTVSGMTVDAARRSIQSSGLIPVGDTDPSWIVTDVSPPPGQIYPFDTQVAMTTEPPASQVESPDTRPTDGASVSAGDGSEPDAVGLGADQPSPWWAIVAAFALLLTLGALAAARVSGRQRQRRLVSEHVTAWPGAGPISQQIEADTTRGRTHAVRLIPHPGTVEQSIEEGEER